MGHEMLVGPLRQVALFAGLSDQQLAAIARSAERIVYRPGETIVRDGVDLGASVLIVAGDADRVEQTNIPVEAGSLICEMSMFIDTEASATVVARSAVRALKFNRHAMLEEMTEDPTLAEHFVGQISGRLRDIAQELRRVDSVLGGEQPIDVEWKEIGSSGSQPRVTETAHA